VSAPAATFELERDRDAGGGLGPAVTDNFAEALGLHELVDRVQRPDGDAESRTALSSQPAPAAPAQPAPVPMDPRILEQLCKVVDAMVSAFAGVTPEDDIQPLAVCLQPLAEHYGGGTNAVAAMWLTAAIGVASYGLAKWSKYQTAHPAKPKYTAPMKDARGESIEFPDVATPPADKVTA
jgi:hypothetical protein